MQILTEKDKELHIDMNILTEGYNRQFLITFSIFLFPRFTVCAHILHHKIFYFLLKLDILRTC